MTNSFRHKVALPACVITEVCQEGAPGSTLRKIPAIDGRQPVTYHFRPITDDDGVVESMYNLFPVILDGKGGPWDIAMIYLLSRLEGVSLPNMTTFHSIADDLGAFKAFLDEKEIDFTDFPQNKQKRPTYRYHGYLKQQIFARTIRARTAKRRMGCVIAFYRWLIRERIIPIRHDPWEEREYYLEFKDSVGLSATKKVVTTDVSIKVPKQDYPFDGSINDGGKLRPMPPNEQHWIIEALAHFGNSEMTLMHLFMLLSGARIQSALTLRVRHVRLELPDGLKEVRLVAGPGTNIDTKFDKPMTLCVPRKLYELLRIYSHSERAQRRRNRAPGGDTEDQYLFLTQHGAPFYQAKSDALAFDPSFDKRHQKRGQAVRQFLTDYLIPYIRRKHDPKFHYQIHDLRATFGMNLTDVQLKLVETGTISLSQARAFVQKMMCHAHPTTTDRYLDYRKQMQMVYAAIDGYEVQVENWISRSMAGLLDE